MGRLRKTPASGTAIRHYVWVAVRVQRGFVTDVLAFGRRADAMKKLLCWRKTLNPDYDEVAVRCTAVKEMAI